ncbi:MAG: fibronectin type III domain-containing protein [Nocardioides sp.]
MSADGGVKVGTVRDIVVTIDDGSTEPVTGRVPVKVVASTRPLMTTRLAEINDADAGEPETVDINDYVTNPFSDRGEAIELVGQPVVTSGEGTTSANGTSVTVTPAEDFHGSMTVSYQVEDATHDAARRVEGMIRLNVRSVPDAPTGLLAEGTERSGTVSLSWSPGPANGTPITGFKVLFRGPTSGEQEFGQVSKAEVTGLTNGKPYTFRVVAINEVGESEPSAWSRQAVPDQVPSAPTSLHLSFKNKGLVVTWAQPAYEGTPVHDYVVEYNGRQETVGRSKRVVLDGLANGTQYKIRVRGINEAEGRSRDGVMGASEWSAGMSEKPERGTGRTGGPRYRSGRAGRGSLSPADLDQRIRQRLPGV